MEWRQDIHGEWSAAVLCSCSDDIVVCWWMEEYGWARWIEDSYEPSYELEIFTLDVWPENKTSWCAMCRICGKIHNLPTTAETEKFVDEMRAA